MTVSADMAYARLAKAHLARAEGFRQCDDRTLQALVDGGVIQRASRGTWICRRNDPFEELCLIVEGVLESSLRLDATRRHLVAYSAAGDVLGLVCCIDRKPAPHDIQAHSEAILLRIPVSVINRYRAVDPALLRAFELQLAARARQFYDRLSEALLLPFEARLARRLLELVAKFGVERESRTRIVLRVPQSDLADLLGSSRQRVNQALKSFEARGFLSLGHSSIEAIDVAMLRQEAAGMVAPESTGEARNA